MSLAGRLDTIDREMDGARTLRSIANQGKSIILEVLLYSQKPWLVLEKAFHLGWKCLISVDDYIRVILTKIFSLGQSERSALLG